MVIFYGEIDENQQNLLKNLFDEAMKSNGQNPDIIQMDFSVISAEEMRELNNRIRGIDYATDVLSFPSLEGCLTKKINPKNYPFDVNPETGLVYLGEIMINLQKAIEQAKEYGHSVTREFCYLFVHGCMHLLGYDHEDENDKKIMREHEEKVLNKFDITREN